MNIIKQNNLDIDDLWKGIFVCCVPTRGGSKRLDEKNLVFLFFLFFFLGFLGMKYLSL
jgi:hypothetical protein